MVRTPERRSNSATRLFDGNLDAAILTWLREYANQGILITDLQLNISGWNIAGYSLLGAGIICGGLGIYFNSQAEKSASDAASRYDDYTKASSDHDNYWNKYTAALNDVKQNQSSRNILYIAGGVSLGAGLILALLPSQEKQNVSFVVLPDSLAVNYRF